MKTHNAFQRVVAGSALALASGVAFADYVTDTTAAITAAATAIGTVGAAILVMIVGAKVFKWIRRAL